jgi:hypothetical protein
VGRTIHSRTTNSLKKTKELWIKSKTTTNINVNDIVIDRVKQFTYLGSVVMVDRVPLQDVKSTYQ